MRCLFALALTAAPAQAAEYMHCYLRDAPAEAQPSSQYNVSGMIDAVQVAHVKHACGTATQEDRDVLDRIVAAGQCSPESEIAGFARETFDIPVEAAAEGLKAESSEAIFERLCAATDACVAGDLGYDDACLAGLDAAIGG